MRILGLHTTKKIFFISLFIVVFFQGVYAQNSLSVNGKVTDQDGVGIPFASIVVKNSNQGVSTDVDGNYTITVKEGEVLIISSLGYKTLEVVVSGNKTLDIVLEDATATLGEVVVVGYGTQKKKDLTGAISVVASKEVSKRIATTVAESLQGLATGVTVRGSTQPGSEAKIEIRGLKNLQNSNPLYVIDGLITTANRDFNPNDVESIQILKDAAAAAIYGSRAANGVIIITTKKGKEGPMKVEISSKTSFSTLPQYNLTSTPEFARLNYQAYENGGLTRANLREDINTDWQRAVFNTGVIQDHNASVSGGSKNSSFFLSLNYFRNKGAVISTDFNRKSIRVNTTGTKGIFTLGESFAFSHAKADEMSGNPFVDVVRMLPTIPIYDDRNPGGYGYGEQGVANTFGTNPIALADLVDSENSNYRLRGNVWAEVKPFDFLTYKISYGLENSFDEGRFLRKLGNWTLNQPFDPSTFSQRFAKSQSQILDNTLTFKKEYKKHNITLVLGNAYQKAFYKFVSGVKRNLPIATDGTYFTELALGNSGVANGASYESNLLSYFGRLEYNYDDKYLLNAVFRRDGSSKFSKNNKWENFPSLSLAWRLSNESFFNVDMINDLKLRASYGELGSGEIGSYDFQGVINTYAGVIFGSNQALYPGATQVQLTNNELKWERLIQKNYGIDLAMFNNKFQLSAEYFDAKTENVLFGYPILITTGNDGGNPIANGATMQNRGVEISLSYKQAVNDALNFNASINFTKLKNRLVSLGNGLNRSIQGITITEVNESVGMWYLLKTDGLFQNQTEIDNYKSSNGTIIMPYAKPGDIKFVDYNNDGQITEEDKHVVGNPWPKFEMGLNLGADYKGFDFSMNWIGSFGADVYSGYRSVVDRFDDDSNYRAGIVPWTPENPNTDFPRIAKESTLNSRADSDRWLEDGSFVRLKYIGLGYTIPKEVLNFAGIEDIRLNLSGQNIFTITKYQGLDPEFVNGSIFHRGHDNFAYPNAKIYSLGFNIRF